MKKTDQKPKQSTKKQPSIKYADTQYVLKVTEKFMKEYAEALEYLKNR